MNNMKSQYTKYCRGFTLVEIMVAITLSLFLIGGLVQIYASNKKSSLLQRNLAEMQESQRLAIHVLTHDIRMAGYYNGTVATNVQDVPRFYVDKDDTRGLSMEEGGVDGDGEPLSDSITVVYESTKDCLGQNIVNTVAGNLDKNGNTIAINKYYVMNETLYCVGNGGSDGKYIGQPIADGVVNMQILYGENVDKPDPFGDPEKQFVDRYVQPRITDADKTNPAKADLDKVVTVRIALLLMTTNYIKNKEEEVTYQLLAPGLTKKDKRRYEVATTTIALRNFNLL